MLKLVIYLHYFLNIYAFLIFFLYFLKYLLGLTIVFFFPLFKLKIKLKKKNQTNFYLTKINSIYSSLFISSINIRVA